MKRVILAIAAVTLVASSTGCCCLDRLFCWGCRGSCPYGGGGYYGNEGSCCGGCGGGGCSDCGSYGGGGMARGGSGAYARRGGGMPMVAEGGNAYPPRTVAPRRPAGGHPLVHQRRDAGGEYEFAAGPPTGATTYPYYTTRGPRDFLARNPRDIGP